jgi:hypothetical protein
VSPEDLKDFVGPRSFLVKYKGIKQVKYDAKLAQERAEDRQKRTFAQAGISVVTGQGEKILTVVNAKSYKDRINAEKNGGQTAESPVFAGEQSQSGPIEFAY